jgi:hypothetical protein
MSDTEVLEQETPSVDEEVASEEPTEETESLEEYSEYKFKYGDEDVTMSPEEFERFYKDYRNEQKWQTKYHKKGEALNQRERELDARQREVEAIRTNATEWEAIKKQLNQNPEGRKFIAELLNQSQPSVDPVIEEQQNEIRYIRHELAQDKAIAKLSQQFSDFDADVLNDFTNGFDFRNQEDLMLYGYYAWLGSQLEDKVSEARANVVRNAKKKKGLPPTGKKEAAPKEKGSTIAEMARNAMAAIQRGETLY